MLRTECIFIIWWYVGACRAFVVDGCCTWVKQFTKTIAEPCPGKVGLAVGRAGCLVRRKPPHIAGLTRKPSTCDPKRGRPLVRCTETWKVSKAPPSEVLYCARCACDSRASARGTMQQPRAITCSAAVFSSGARAGGHYLVP